MINELEQAIIYFKKETFESVKAGIKEIGKVAIQMNKDIQDCKLVVENIDDLSKMANEFSNPLSFAYHVGKDLIVNSKDIYKQINDSVI